MKHNLPIFIINLEESVDRKNSIIKQLENITTLYNKVGAVVDYQFFPAVNGNKQPNFYLFDKYNKQKRYWIKGHYATLSQLGCFASHYLLWEKCIKLNQPIIILEDDIVLEKNFIDVYNFCLSESNIYEFFWLSPPSKPKHSEKSKELYKDKDSSFCINRYYNSWDNTNGYFLSPSAAKKLLLYCQEWVYDVDISMNRYWENKIQYLAVYPPCIKLSAFAQESTIPIQKEKKNRTFFIRCRREFFNSVDLIKKSFFNLFKL